MGIGLFSQEKVDSVERLGRVRNNRVLAFVGDDAMDIAMFFGTTIRPFGRVLILDISYESKMMDSIIGVKNDGAITVHGIDYCINKTYCKENLYSYDVVIIFNNETNLDKAMDIGIQHIYYCLRLQNVNIKTIVKSMNLLPKDIQVTVVCRDEEVTARAIYINSVFDIPFTCNNVEEKIFFVPFNECDVKGFLLFRYGECNISTLSKNMQELLSNMYERLRYLSRQLIVK